MPRQYQLRRDHIGRATCVQRVSVVTLLLRILTGDMRTAVMRNAQMTLRSGDAGVTANGCIHVRRCLCTAKHFSTLRPSGYGED
jgi:hypothetical protein